MELVGVSRALAAHRRRIASRRASSRRRRPGRGGRGVRSAGWPRAVAAVVALAIAGSAATTSYTVRRGDTLSAIAARFHVSVRDLAGANGVTNPDRIDAGAVLTIPGPAPTVAVAAADAAQPVNAPLALGVLPAQLLAHPSRLALRRVFRRWAAAYRVPADLVEALAWMESGWQTKVVSPTGAIGIGQLEPATVAFVCGVLLHTKLNPRVAGDNIRMTARFLSSLLQATGGDAATAVGAYYQGLDSMRSGGPLAITRVYVADVLALRRSFFPG